MKKGDTVFRFKGPGKLPQIYIVMGETLGERGTQYVLFNDIGSETKVYAEDVFIYADAEYYDKIDAYDKAQWVDVSTPSMQRFIEETHIGWETLFNKNKEADDDNA